MRDKFEPINKENVVDQIISVITDSVVKGKYKPGMKLPSEYELIEELKVSRNSLREAMKSFRRWELWRSSGVMERISVPK